MRKQLRCRSPCRDRPLYSALLLPVTTRSTRTRVSSAAAHTHTRAHGGVNYNSCGQLTGSAAYHLKLVVGEGFASICFVNEFARIIRIHVDDDDDIVLESLL